MHIHDLPVGRNVEEVLRCIEALQFHEKHGDVCPVSLDYNIIYISCIQ
jgi:alkyl hydroperoxide reductase subunit AhpC